MNAYYVSSLWPHNEFAANPIIIQFHQPPCFCLGLKIRPHFCHNVVCFLHVKIPKKLVCKLFSTGCVIKPFYEVEGILENKGSNI